MTRRDLLLHARRKCECEGTTLTSGRKWQSVQHRRSQQASGCRGTQFAYPSSPDRLGVHNAGSGAMPTGTPGCFCRKASTSKACSYAASSLSTARWTGRPGLPARPPAARSARPTRRTRRRRRRGRRRRGARQRREWAAREASREAAKGGGVADCESGRPAWLAYTRQPSTHRAYKAAAEVMSVADPEDSGRHEGPPRPRPRGQRRKRHASGLPAMPWTLRPMPTEALRRGEIIAVYMKSCSGLLLLAELYKHGVHSGLDV